MLTAPFEMKAAIQKRDQWAAHLGRPASFKNSIDMAFVLIPPGEFEMGSPESEAGRNDDEKIHRVRITEPYYIGKYLVSQSEFQRVMGRNPSSFSSTGDRTSDRNKVQNLDTRRFPVESASWDDATDFCKRLTEKEHKSGTLSAKRKYALPTEAQWEYACRAGTVSPFFQGGAIKLTDANFGATKKNPLNASLGRPTEVGSYPANAFGIFEMQGNVRGLARPEILRRLTNQ